MANQANDNIEGAATEDQDSGGSGMLAAPEHGEGKGGTVVVQSE